MLYNYCIKRFRISKYRFLLKRFLRILVPYFSLLENLESVHIVNGVIPSILGLYFIINLRSCTSLWYTYNKIRMGCKLLHFLHYQRQFFSRPDIIKRGKFGPLRCFVSSHLDIKTIDVYLPSNIFLVSLIIPFLNHHRIGWSCLSPFSRSELASLLYADFSIQRPLLYPSDYNETSALRSVEASRYS